MSSSSVSSQQPSPSPSPSPQVKKQKVFRVDLTELPTEVPTPSPSTPTTSLIQVQKSGKKRAHTHVSSTEDNKKSQKNKIIKKSKHSNIISPANSQSIDSSLSLDNKKKNKKNAGNSQFKSPGQGGEGSLYFEHYRTLVPSGEAVRAMRASRASRVVIRAMVY